MFNPQTFPRRSAFTLVELLTVIAIIAVLMGILFPVIGSAIETAKKTQAKNDEQQLVTAIKSYYTEYGRYPTSAVSDVTLTGSDQANLMNELRVPSSFTPTLNPRKISFIEVADAKNLSSPETKQKSGISSSGKYLDPWGNAYFIKLDGDYDNSLDNPYGTNNAGAGKLTLGVIVWSYGRDGKLGSKASPGDFKASDDVISWQ